MDPDLHVRDWVGRMLTIQVDRPAGTPHPKHPEIRYPLNYGYVPGVPAPDGEDLDAYILGPDAPLALGEACRALVVAIVRRRDDIEDKLVTVAEGHDPAPWDAEAIRCAVAFQEQCYDSWVEMPAHTSGPTSAPATDHA